MSGARSYTSLEDLPQTLPIFPLTGALLLPRAHLPLNVFEPRYLAMVDAVLAGERLIGMIQPTEDEATSVRPALSDVGCAGRLTGYRETEDGRYLITLTGVCRFRVEAELDAATAFRQVCPQFAPFLSDLVEPAEDETSGFPRDHLMEALKAYLARRDLKADWDSVTDAPAEALVNALAMLCPFEANEKQALLEAEDWRARVGTLIALLEMDAADDAGGTSLN